MLGSVAMGMIWGGREPFDTVGKIPLTMATKDDRSWTRKKKNLDDDNFPVFVVQEEQSWWSDAGTNVE